MQSKQLRPSNPQKLEMRALILAAGRSSRMGSPKATLPLPSRQGGHRPLVLQHLERLRDVGVASLRVVLGHGANPLLEALPILQSVAVINPDPDRGQFSSLQVGLQALTRDVGLQEPRATDAWPCCGIFVTPVDCPPVPFQVYTQLWQALQERSSELFAIVPTCQGLPGHPVLLAPLALDALLAAPPGSSLETHFQRAAAQVLRLEVGERAILWNLNTPDDLARYRAEAESGSASGLDTLRAEGSTTWTEQD